MTAVWKCVKLCLIISRETLSSWSFLPPFWSCNRHNTRIWGLRNPVQIHEHEKDAPKLIMWCAISSAGLIGPFFFHDQEGHSVNVTGDNYLCMLQEFCVSKLSAVANLQQVIFQQDGAPAYYLCEVRVFLDEQFPDQWIGCRGLVE